MLRMALVRGRIIFSRRGIPPTLLRPERGVNRVHGACDGSALTGWARRGPLSTQRNGGLNVELGSAIWRRGRILFPLQATGTMFPASMRQTMIQQLAAIPIPGRLPAISTLLVDSEGLLGVPTTPLGGKTDVPPAAALALERRSRDLGPGQHW